MLRQFLPALIAASLAAFPAAAAELAPAPVPAAPATAQPARQPLPQQPSVSNLTVNEKIGDWTVRCFQVQSIAPCDVMQMASRQETNQRVLLTTIAYVPSQNAYAVQFVVPLGVVLARGMTIDAGAGSLPGAKFTRCERDGCYVEGPLPVATVEALSAMTGRTNMSLIAYGTNEKVSLPLSLNGFGAAIERMRAEARRRATAQ